MIRALIAWGPAVTWAAVLFFLSEVRALRPSVWLAVHDKLVHVALYAVLGAALAWAKRKGGAPWPHWAFLALGVLYGVVDELHQTFVPGRIPEVADLYADVVGLLVGYLLVLSVWSAVTRLTRQPT